jgi:hypothetical protein
MTVKEMGPAVATRRAFFIPVKNGCLCGGPLLLDLFRLQIVQIIRGALRMGGGGEDQALVVLQRLQP